jgi:hypothetical protein
VITREFLARAGEFEAAELSSLDPRRFGFEISPEGYVLAIAKGSPAALAGMPASRDESVRIPLLLILRRGSWARGWIDRPTIGFS